MTPKQRQKAILDLVESSQVKSQRELEKLLAKRGIDVTQSTLSRDITEIGLVKGADGYKQITPSGREMTSARELRSMLRAFILEVETITNQVLLKTTSGGANAAADLLDDAGWNEVAGTIAGDDTILIIARGAKKAKSVEKRILRMLA